MGGKVAIGLKIIIFILFIRFEKIVLSNSIVQFYDRNNASFSPQESPKFYSWDGGASESAAKNAIELKIIIFILFIRFKKYNFPDSKNSKITVISNDAVHCFGQN